MSDAGIALAAEQKRAYSSRYAYVVTTFMGLAFCLTLVKSAWDTTLDRTKTNLQYDVLSIQQTISRNVVSANDVTNNVAAFVAASDDLNKDQFGVFAEDILSRYTHLDSINYFQFAGNEEIKKFPLLYQVSSDTGPVEPGQDIYLEFQFRAALDTAMATGKVVPSPLIEQHESSRQYWLFKAVDVTAETGQPGSEANGSVKGIVAVLVSPAKSVGHRAQDKALTITLYSDTVNLYGRTQLYASDEEQTEERWVIENFVEEESVQIPPYSIKISAHKSIFFTDLDFGLIFVSILLGGGILLLMYGLMNARRQQETELRERNKLIEQKVEEQTFELEVARDEAVKAVKMKSEFLASMSHEIRTPLNAIIGMSDLMSETTMNDEQTRYVSVFRKAGDALLTLVNDILDLSKIEAGQLVLENISFNMMEMVEEAADIYALKAADKQLEIITNIDTSVNIYRIGDPGRLKQVLLNLISNALKFTERGQIVVSLKLPKDAGDKDDVCMSVRDTGIGIPVAKLEAIFESFTQADTSTTRRYGGTGLGLTICRHLVTLMNGQIWVESEEGKGSEFFVKVNLAQQDKPRVVPPDLTDKSILIIDSRLDNCLALEETLKYCGATCVNATTVKNCVNYLTNQQEPDIVIVDSYMLLDESVELKSAFSNELKQKTLVTISPSYMTRHQSVVERDGYRKILMKPLKRSELLDAISSMYKRTSKEDVDKIIKPTADEKVAKSLHILLVEDNPDNRMLIRAYLKKTDHILEEAENGEIALDRFMSKKYDMVFMDIQMPVMDGHEATKRIRAWEQKNNKEKTPIIALTAHAIKEEIDKCIASGCDSHLGKPVKKATLLEAIQGIG